MFDKVMLAVACALIAANASAWADEGCKATDSNLLKLEGAAQTALSAGELACSDARFALEQATCQSVSPLRLREIVDRLVRAYLAMPRRLPPDSPLAGAALGFASVAADASDLPAVLVPNGWLQPQLNGLPREANASSARDRAAKDWATKAYCFDVAAVVEALAANLAKDRRLLAAYESARAESKALWEEAKTREGMGQIPPGSSDEAGLMLDRIDADRSVLSGLVDQQTSALKDLLGPSWEPRVDRLALGQQAPVDSSRELEQLALQRSPEIYSADQLLSAARLSARSEGSSYELYRPSSSDEVAAAMAERMSFSEAAGIPKGPGQVAALDRARESVKASVVAKAESAARGYSQAVSASQASAAKLAEARENLDRAVEELHLGVVTDSSKVQKALMQSLQFRLEDEANQAKLEIDHARLERMLLTGDYSFTQERWPPREAL